MCVRGVCVCVCGWGGGVGGGVWDVCAEMGRRSVRWGVGHAREVVRTAMAGA